MLHLDKIYASVELRRTMRQKGTHINMETRSRDYIRKRGPKFRFDAEKYKTRFLVERLNAWLKTSGASEYDGIDYLQCTKDLSI